MGITPWSHSWYLWKANVSYPIPRWRTSGSQWLLRDKEHQFPPGMSSHRGCPIPSGRSLEMCIWAKMNELWRLYSHVCTYKCTHMKPRALTPPTDAPHQAVSLWKMEPRGRFGVNMGRGRREENKREKCKANTVLPLSYTESKLNTYISHGCRKETVGGGRGFTRAVKGEEVVWW